MTNDLINGKYFSTSEAKLVAGKAAYLVVNILMNQDECFPFKKSKEIIAELKNNLFKGKLGILDCFKGNLENYFYRYKIVQLLE